MNDNIIIRYGVTFRSSEASIGETGPVAETALEALSWAARFVGAQPTQVQQQLARENSPVETSWYDEMENSRIVLAWIESGIVRLQGTRLVWVETLDSVGRVSLKDGV